MATRATLTFCFGILVINNRCCTSLGTSDIHHRIERSALTYPPGSVLQLTIAVSAAFDLADPPTGHISYGFQQNFQLPTNYTELTLRRARRDIFPYDHLQDIFTRSAVNGTECLKKTICDVARSPLRGGLIEDILNFVFTPSNHDVLFSGAVDEGPYRVAESIGRTNGGCHSVFADCWQSPLELITELVPNLSMK